MTDVDVKSSNKMSNFGDDLYPLALLMDELKHDDLFNRVEAMQKLETIAIALGPERTLHELLPFLNEVCQDDEEEVFTIMANKLGDFIPFVGGHKNCEPLIQILSVLASMEEPIVRDNAVNSLNKISKELDDHEINYVFLHLIQTLSQGNWFSKKIASCGLFKSVITRVSSECRNNLLNQYYKLITDEYPMIRRSAASNFPHLINLISKFEFTNTDKKKRIMKEDWEIIIKVYHYLLKDDQDSVRFLSVDILIEILDHFRIVNECSLNNDFLEDTLTLISDQSWRVRYATAEKFCSIALNFNNNEYHISKLVDPFISLMKDDEGEVRKVIAKQLPCFCNLLIKHESKKILVLTKIIDIINEISRDQNEVVRASLASTITDLSPILEKHLTIEKLLPIFLVMLKDECPDVRLNFISNLSIIIEVIGINLLSTDLLPAIMELAQDHKWRVRLAIIKYIPKLASQLGESFFNNKLLSLCLSWLWDPIFAIRDSAVTNLKELAEIFGSQWAENEIINRLLEINTNFEDEKINYSKFIIRITCLFAVTNLVTIVKPNVIIKKILPFVDNLISDSVPNIRFNVAKTYLVIVENLIKDKKKLNFFNDLIKNDILNNLEKLKNDEDVDVRFYTKMSVDGINALLQ